MDGFSVLITGDLVLSQVYNISSISDDVINLFESSDLNVVNLEAPVTSSTSKILKTGPHLKSDKNSTLQFLKALNVGVVTLANNHVLDYDEQGVSDTLSFCKENNIETIGAGIDLKEASKTLYLETEEGRIAIVNFAENEWASATEKSAGANPMDVIDNARQIKDAKGRADFVFVIIHGGHEYYNLPSPRIQVQYRYYAEQGADIIVGHHTHCISGYEIHNGVPIYYSLGNFLFTDPSTYNDWYKGLLLEVKIIGGKLIPKLHPIEQLKDTFQLQILSGEDKQYIVDRISSYNCTINDEISLKNEWKNYVDSKYNSYLRYWSPLLFVHNRYLKAVFNRLKIKMINKKGMALILNLMRCEAHSDLSKQIICKYLKK